MAQQSNPTPGDLLDKCRVTSKSKGFEVLVFFSKKLKPRMDSKTL